MGCDIHQINIIIDAKTKKPYAVDGDVPLGGEDEEYKSEWIEQFINGRSSDLFAILAGVNGESFKIIFDVNNGIPEELPKEIVDRLKNPEYSMHSFVWYYLPDLEKQLKWTAEKIDMYIKARSAEPEFIEFGEIDDYKWLCERVKKLAEYLKQTHIILHDRGHKEDYNVSKIFFCFDS